jgi:GNAT superfamily N-acetyltransferase
MSSSLVALFEVRPYRAIELGDADVPQLQEFFERNPQYYLIVGDEPPSPTEAHDEVHGPLPEGWTYTKKWIVGFFDADRRLVGMANVVSDIIAPTVWHIGFFLVATELHGFGAAKSLYQALEDWMRALGAKWLRLGVVEGNVRAERFWSARGYVETRKRHGIAMGKRSNTVRVMVKPFDGGQLADYLALVARDRPE